MRVITAERARIVVLSILEQAGGEAVLRQDAHAVRGQQTSTRPTFDVLATLAFRDQAVNFCGP